jgi:capsular exopolysaccharide synthesis family protein
MNTSHSNLPNEEHNKDFKRLLTIFGKNKFLTFLIVALSVLGGLVYAYFSQPVYETYSTIEVSNDKLDMNMMMNKGLSEDATLIDTQVEIIRSRNLIEQAAAKVDYQTHYFTLSNYKENELYKDNPIEVSALNVKNPHFYGTKFILEVVDDNHFKLYTKTDGVISLIKKTASEALGKRVESIAYSGQHAFNDKIETPDFSFVIKKRGTLNNSKYTFYVLDKDNTISSISKNLSVFPTAKNGSVIKMIYQDNVAQRAKDFLDALVDIYLSQSVTKKSSQASQALTFVDEQLKEVSKKLQESAIKLENYKEENNLINIETESDVTLRQLSDYKAQLSDIKIQESAFQSLYEEFKRGNYGAVSSLAKEYPVLETLLSDFQKAKSEKISLLGTFTEEHPDVEKSNEKIEDIKMALESSIESINDSLRERKRSLEDTLYAKETNLLKLPEKERELADLTRKYGVNEKTYQFLLEKQAEMSINKASTVSSNRVLDRATVQKRPIKPNTGMILGASALLGLIAALLLALIRDLMDNKIKTRDDLSHITKIPFYGVIPHVRSSEKMFILEDQQSVASEALRLIRTNLEFISTDKKGKVIVVSSTIPGEGKTTTATNLAGVFGMSDKKCIVISLDMRRPMLHRVFALTNKVGMSTVLSKNSELKDVIWEHKKIENLDIITSGPIPPNPSELMQSGKLDKLIEELREAYDYIIVDSPPMGSITDAIILMKLADISLVVFRSEFSEKDFVKSLEEVVGSYNIDNVGIVLNDVKPKNMSQSFFKYSYTYK